MAAFFYILGVVVVLKSKGTIFKGVYMQIAAYYFPNYHADKRNEEYHGTGWTEWELMKCAGVRFSGHRLPRQPLWGYEDEADPAVMAKKIDAAADARIDAFVFDWYWYDGPYLERALDEGFLKAKNRDRMKFALMFANHDWMDRHPVGYSKAANSDLLYGWNNTLENIGDVWDIIVGKYLTSPLYWYVENVPYFSIYQVNRFIIQMGGMEGAAQALEMLRSKVKAAGLPGVHINAIWYDNLDNHPQYVCCTPDWSNKIGFDSYTSYNCVFATDVWMNSFPVVDYAVAGDEYCRMAEKAMKTLPKPYYPVITAGWDTTPRTIQSDIFRQGAYPYLPVMESTPQEFARQLENTANLLAKRPEAEQLIFINAWNEWTEGSFLEPDTVVKYQFLDAIKKFRNNKEEA